MPVMRSRRLVRALPAGLLAVALLAACGDDSAEDPAGAEAAAQQARLALARAL